MMKNRCMIIAVILSVTILLGACGTEEDSNSVVTELPTSLSDPKSILDDSDNPLSDSDLDNSGVQSEANSKSDALSDELLAKNAEAIAKHFILHALSKDYLSTGEYTDDDIRNFVISLCLYSDNQNHPYSSIVKDGETTEVSSYLLDDDVERMVYELFAIDQWKCDDLLTTNSANMLVYNIPDGIGMPTSPYGYENLKSYVTDDIISVEFDLKDTDLYPSAGEIYGRYCLEYFVMNKGNERFLRQNSMRKVS